MAAFVHRGNIFPRVFATLHVHGRKQLPEFVQSLPLDGSQKPAVLAYGRRHETTRTGGYTDSNPRRTKLMEHQL